MIDEKGKIFGKINVIDLLVVLLVIAIAVLLGLKFVSNTGEGIVQGTPVIYTVKVNGVKPEVYESIKNELPSQLMASGEMLDGYVTGVTAEPAAETSISMREDADTGYLAMQSKREGMLDLTFTIEASIKNTVTNELGTQEIRIGKSHIVKTTTFELNNGTILTLESVG